MRILFISGTTTGGAAQSTRELAARVASHGHEVEMLCRRKPRRDMGDGAKRSRFTTVAKQIGRGLLRNLPISPKAVGGETYPMWRTTVVERAIPIVFDRFAPDVVVVNSVYRKAWELILQHARAKAVPVVLYQREQSTFENLRAWESRPDLLVANAVAHETRVTGRGVTVEVIPSIVDCERYRVESRRETALFVNPITSRGLDVAIELAQRRPDVRFVFQESWPLNRGALRGLVRRLADLDNVEFRTFNSDGAAVYRDARVLLAPYRSDNRPRVVLEAQFNGIPTLATDYPGLREAVGPGGLLVPSDAPIDAWVTALATLWDDPAKYAELVRTAAEHARRPEIDPELLTRHFETLLRGVVDRASRTAVETTAPGPATREAD